MEMTTANLSKLMIRMMFIKTLQRLDVLNRFETIHEDQDGSWYMKQ